MAKSIVIYFLLQNNESIEPIVVQINNMPAIGIITVLMLSISRVSRRAQRQEIRAEILALQNQDLVSSLGSMLETNLMSPEYNAQSSDVPKN